MGRRLSCLSACVLAVTVAACVGEPAPDSAMTTPLVLDQTVQQTVQSILSDYKPPATITELSQTQEINNVGNFGKLVYYQSHAVYARQDNGLWEVAGSGGFTNGDASSSGESLVLCGLVVLLNTSGSTSSVNTTTAASVGKGFIPFGINSTVQFGVRRRVTKLETTAHLCTPTPGTSFSYHVESEAWIKTSGMFGQTRHVTGVIDVTCHVASSVTPAGEIAPALRGDALHISCETTVPSGTPHKSEYVFLRDVALYLQLSLGEPGDVQTTKIRYDAVGYGT